MKIYDIAIIGAGSGGITAAVGAAGFGKKVLLIDKNKPGGECTWSGCVPSKALINEAKKIHIIKNNVKDYVYDSKKAMDHVHAVRDKVYSHETPEELSKLGIEFLQGEATFKDSNTLLVDGNEIKAKKYIISTGSSPFIPPIEGLNESPFLTNENIFELKTLPKSIIILGGGPIGIELAQALNRLGTNVQIIEMMDRLIFREEQEFSHAIEKKISEEGVKIRLNARAIEVKGNKKKISLIYDKDDTQVTVTAESLLVAIGRKPNIEGLGLNDAKIKYNNKGIEVNNYLQTSIPHIYAIGDVTGPYQFSHMANVQGIKAVQNAILPFKKKINYDHVAWVTFTEPEMARAGMTEPEAREKFGNKIRVYDYDFNDLDRAITSGETIERMKLILNKKGKILGISILANRAGEMIGEAQLLKSSNMNFSKMASVIHPYPTYGEVFSKLGKRVMIDNILNNPIVKIFRKNKK